MDTRVLCDTDGCERKGIVLGIVYYILKHHRYFATHPIQCDDDWYRDILGHIFPAMRFFKKKSDVFQINIKNHRVVGLVINNINNLPHIYAKSIYWLPYYEPNNPLVMYRARDLRDKDQRYTDQRYTDQRDKLAKEIRRFERYRVCEWEQMVERAIVNKYARVYGHGFELQGIIGRLCGVPWYERTGIDMGVGVPMPVRVDVPVPIRVDVPAPPCPACPTCPPVPACPTSPTVPTRANISDYARLVGLLGDKFEALNRIVDASRPPR